MRRNRGRGVVGAGVGVGGAGSGGGLGSGLGLGVGRGEGVGVGVSFDAPLVGIDTATQFSEPSGIRAMPVVFFISYASLVTTMPLGSRRRSSPRCSMGKIVIASSMTRNPLGGISNPIGIWNGVSLEPSPLSRNHWLRSAAAVSLLWISTHPRDSSCGSRTTSSTSWLRSRADNALAVSLLE